MLTVIFLMFLQISIFSPENLITTLVGALATFGLTHWIKSQTGLQGVGALIVAIIVSFIVAAASFLISTLLINGNHFSWELLPHAATQIFALATIAYKVIMSDGDSTGN